MASRRAWAMVVLLAGCSAGCGTIRNLSETEATCHARPELVPKAYGGVRKHVSELRDVRWDNEYAFLNVVAIPFYILDMPLSFVGDTLTLPITIALEARRGIAGYYFPPKPDAPATKVETTER